MVKHNSGNSKTAIDLGLHHRPAACGSGVLGGGGPFGSCKRPTADDAFEVVVVTVRPELDVDNARCSGLGLTLACRSATGPDAFRAMDGAVGNCSGVVL